MAEMLSVVASGIALAQVAWVLGQIIMSLCRLWRWRTFPIRRVRCLVQERELVGKSIDAIETELPVSSSESLLAFQCQVVIQRCRQAKKDLSDLVDDLGLDIASSRRRKS
jgi:hypothetical protein